LILRWMRQGALIVEDLTEIAAIDPAVARLASDEMLCFVLRRVAQALSKILAARDRDHHLAIAR
jgi:hypothetical protein